MLAITHTKSKIRGYILTLTTALLVAASSLAMPFANAANISIGGPSDCDSNAVIMCGAHTTGSIVSKYRANMYAQKVYAAFGIGAGAINNLNNTNVAGYVTRSGQVYVNGRANPVARGAVTAGRQNIAGSTAVNHNGAIFYRRPPSVSFQQSSLPAFVAMSNGRFMYAIIASCGNPVTATPTTTPTPPAPVTPKPAPQPKPQVAPKPKPVTPARAPVTQTQSQNQTQVNNQNQQVVVQTPVTQTQSAPTPAPAPETETVAAAPVPATETVAAPAQEVQAQPASLPNTGPAGIAGVFTVASLAGFWGFRRFRLHQLS